MSIDEPLRRSSFTSMLGNYGPPFARFECVVRDDAEIRYADGIGLPVGACCKAAIYAVVAGGWIAAVRSAVAHPDSRPPIIGEANPFPIFGALILLAGAIILIAALPAVTRDFWSGVTRQEWRLLPHEGIAEWRRKPPFGAVRCERFEPGTITSVRLVSEAWRNRPERHWALWITIAGGRSLCVDHGREENALRNLATDLSQMFAWPLSETPLPAG